METTTKKEIIQYVWDNLNYELILDDIHRYTVNQEDNTKEDFYLGLIEEFIDYIDYDFDNPAEDYNEKNSNGSYYWDLISERVDGEVDIYYSSLYDSVNCFSDYIEDALDEYGYNKDRGFIGIIQAGQYKYYNDFGMAVFDLLYKYTQE